jgi:predicted AlkP superfamily pyrophosphatase or phosphodiesterase
MGHSSIKRIQRISLFAAYLAFALQAAPPDAAQKPKLVLAVVVDQFRYDYTIRFRGDYHAGLARLLDRGAVFTDAHHPHSTTVTAVGHSTFLSGAPPSASGIVGNEWFDRETGTTVTSVSDPKTKLIGGVPGQPGSSPRRLEVSTVVDELKIRGGDSHAIGISIKDRGAILPAGHMADAAYWYDSDSNNWVTSSFYESDLPSWVQAVNAKHGSLRTLGASWLPVDAKEGAEPFCTMVAGQTTRFCGGIEATPWGNELIEEFAESALDGEKLGRHAGVDVLTVSFSSNDYVGHAVGPDDPAVRDMAIRTDRLLGRLLDYIDQRVGAGNTLVVLTADHGVAPVPEVNIKRKMPGGRLSDTIVMKSMTDALVARYGAGNWFIAGTVTMPYLNWDLIRTKKLDAGEVESVAAEAARKSPHIARVYTREQLLKGNVQRDPIGDSMSLSFFAPRFGDLVILPDPYYLFDATGTTHGTPYEYDTHVPLIFYGPGIKPGTYSNRVAVNDVAPTLAEILQVERPSGSIGRVLSEILSTQ